MLLASRYNMRCDVFSQTRTDPDTGEIQVEQDESGQITRIWDVGQENVLNVAPPQTIKCIARGISGGGIRVVGSTERWGNEFEDIEWVKIQTNYRMSKADRVGNIRDSRNRLIWRDDEGRGLIFDVLGATPVMDPFGRHLEYDILCQRVRV